MSDRVRVIQHGVVPGRGRFEVKIPGQPSRFFYFDDLPSRRLSLRTLDRATAMDRARSVARDAEER